MKSLLLTALVASFCSQCLADDVPALKVSSLSGLQSIALAELKSITYSENEMTVNLNDGSSQSFALDDIVVMELENTPKDVTAIVNTHATDGTYSITDLNGRTVSQGNVNNSLRLPSRRGLYILKTGKTTKKILVK